MEDLIGSIFRFLRTLFLHFWYLSCSCSYVATISKMHTSKKSWRHMLNWCKIALPLWKKKRVQHFQTRNFGAILAKGKFIWQDWEPPWFIRYQNLISSLEHSFVFLKQSAVQNNTCFRTLWVMQWFSKIRKENMSSFCFWTEGLWSS